MRAFRTLLLALLVGAAGAAAAPARADFRAALAAFDRGEFAPAADEFERLARIGHASAQYNLGLMLAEGQGRKRDLQASFNWLSAAEMNGLQDGEPVLAQLRTISRLDPIAAEEHALRHRRLTGFELAALPVANDAEFTRPREVDALTVTFPPAAQSRGTLGVVWVAYVIGTDGRVEDAWVLGELPEGLFGSYVEDAVRRQRHSPAMAAGKPVRVLSATQFRMTYYAANPDLTRNASAGRILSDLRSKAASGDVVAKHALGRVLTAYPNLATSADEPQRWLAEAIDQRVVEARYFRGFRGLLSASKSRDAQRAIDDLLEAGYAGSAEAQLLIALNLLRVDDERATSAALNWLGAAAPGNARAARYLAALLVSTPHASLQDVGRAATLVDAQLADRRLAEEPQLWEVAALVAARQGDFAAAVERQKKSRSLARLKAADAGSSLDRLQAYEKNQIIAGLLVPAPQFYSVVARRNAGDSMETCEDYAPTGSHIPGCD